MKEIYPEQFAAIKYAHDVASKLVNNEDYHEAADDYRNGLTFDQIAEVYDIANDFKVTSNVARNAINFLITGTDEFDGLLTPTEAKKIGLEHKVNNGKRLSDEKLGMFGRSKLEHSLTSKYAGRQRNKALSLTSWEDDEKERAYELSQQYRKNGGVDRKKIYKILNDEFHKGKEIRNIETVGYYLSKLRKKKIKEGKHIEVRNKIPWSNLEKGYAFNCLISPEYQIGKKVDLKRITSELNEIFHTKNNERNKGSVNRVLSKIKKENSLRLQKKTKWVIQETERVKELSSQDAYRTEKQIKVQEIADILNHEFHEGRNLRSGDQVRSALRRNK